LKEVFKDLPQAAKFSGWTSSISYQKLKKDKEEALKWQHLFKAATTKRSYFLYFFSFTF
jgi:hypothetical protein